MSTAVGIGRFFLFYFYKQKYQKDPIVLIHGLKFINQLF